MSPKRKPGTGWTPKLYHHKSGQARLRLSGVDHYCGKWGTPEADAEAARLIAEWRARNMQPLPPAGGPTINELAWAFLQHAETYYRKKGKPTGELYCFRSIIRPLRQSYGDTLAHDFTPNSLKAFRELLVRSESGWSRNHVNEQINRVRRIFTWGHVEGLVPLVVVQSLALLPGLRKRKTTARETPKRKPVDPLVIERTLPHVRPAVLRDLILVHRLLGCRAAEVCILRPCDIDQTADPSGVCWLYTPDEFKQEDAVKEIHHWIGPRCRQLLEPYLANCQPDQYVFRTRRGTPYTKDSYGLAIARACKRAGVPRWSPGQIRHTRATEIKEREYEAGRHGREGAQAILQHQQPSTTDIYAERSELARRIQAEIG